MSQQTLSASGSSSKYAPLPSASLSATDVVDVLKRQFWLISAVASLSLLLGVVYWSKAQPWYESRAKVLVTVQDPRLTSDPNSTTQLGDSGIQDEILANHMEMVSARELIKAALTRAGLLELPSIVEQLDDETDAVDYVRDHLLLTKGGDGTARDARTLNIAFRHTNPDDTVKVLNAVVQEYETTLNASLSKAMETATGLIQEAQDKVDGEIKALQDEYIKFSQTGPLLLRQANGVTTIHMATLQQHYTKIAEIDAEIAMAETRLTNVKTSLQRMLAETGEVTLFDKLALIDAETFERLGSIVSFQVAAANSPEFLKDTPMRMQRATLEFQALTELEGEYDRKRANFGDNHDEVRGLKNQIALIRDKMAQSESQMVIPSVFSQTSPEEMLTYYQRSLEHNLINLRSTKDVIISLAAVEEKKAQHAVQFEVQERMLQANIDRKQQLYYSIVEHLQTLNTASGLTGFVHQKLESPELGEIVWPTLPICSLAGCLLGLVAGICLAIMNDQVDKRFRTAAEIDQATGVPVIAQIGRIRRSRTGKRAGRMIADPQAPEAESFRLLRTYLLKDVKSGKLKVLSATSCQTKDGKSTILANIAATFAEMGLKTVIVDGDMRAPTSHRFFDLPIHKGLSELLMSKITLEDAVKATGIDGLSAITAGSAVRNPAELLQSSQFDDLLESLRENFDLVVIDSGPVLWVSDPAIVAQKADATMLVVRSSSDTRRKVQEAVRRLHTANANLRGCILNTYGSAKEFTQDTQYSSPYHYYYGGYGRRVKDEGETAEAKGSKVKGANGSSRNGHS